MDYYIYNFYKLWSGGDYVVIIFVLYSIIISLIDIYCGICSKIICKLKYDVEPEDVVFTHIIIIGLVLFIADMTYNYISGFIGIVDYGDARLTLFRTAIISYSFLIYLLLGLISSSLLLFKSQSREDRKKWGLYGFLFNVLALLYFRKTKRHHSI